MIIIMKKILPLNRELVYGGMCRDRNRLIAITAYLNNLPWYLNNFIPHIMYNTYNIHCYETDNSYEIFDIYDQVAEFSFLKIKNNDLSPIFEALINNEYVLVNWDRYFVKETQNFMKNHEYHEALIYGFDSDKQVLYFHGSMINEKEFDVGEISYKDFLKSISESNNMVSQLEAKHWQYAFGHPFCKFSVNNNETKINLRKMFYKYYTQLRGFQDVQEFNDHESRKHYRGGIAIFDGIYQLLKEAERNNQFLVTHGNALWSIKLMSEHIKSHELRFKYLFDHSFTVEDRVLLNKIDSLSKKVMILYVLLKKYSVFNSKKDIKKCFNLLNEIRSEYIEMLSKCMKIIQNSIECKIS